MGSDDSETIPIPVKLVIAGGFGVGKTTFIGSCSEIRPVRTEELLTTASVGTDDLTGVRAKTTTTVAADFGRITFPYSNHGLVVYLFGTPGQRRFWPLWTELTRGAIGAVVLADVRKLDDCFDALTFFETRDIPFIVAINVFNDAHTYDNQELRAALALPPQVPLLFCDARHQRSVVDVLIGLVEHVHARTRHTLSTLPLGEPR
ncbi:GTP-binding protein [Saccharopolyspora endophytica]|uniref:ATP/GTP-binding protein n=1 Tax=Saccharopolyspora endophytica TaxID=543886 RepID=A0ABS5DQP6_9PSEU|nr:ATP/GTP-binding protein [Saccharopolyspora endophytica]MBQ0928603.1 ATP/GTP-binding protein [Saccharopolyspora endophytica]